MQHLQPLELLEQQNLAHSSGQQTAEAGAVDAGQASTGAQASGAEAAGPDMLNAAADCSTASNLVLAVLQEITRQQF
jgi:hypothetical protein